MRVWSPFSVTVLALPLAISVTLGQSANAQGLSFPICEWA